MSRYDRLLELSTFSKEKLELLHSKRILIIGVGGVGQHIITYLATNGIRNFTIVDFDKVELSNLNRQILLTEKDVGKDKVDVVKSAVLAKNSEIEINVLKIKLTKENIEVLKTNFDVVIDAVDNWEGKLLIAKYAKKNNIPMLHVGVDGIGGQFALFRNKSLLDIVDDSVLTEKRDGVMGPMVGVLSSMASLQLLRYLSGEDIETDTLYSFDQNSKQITRIKI